MQRITNISYYNIAEKKSFYTKLKKMKIDKIIL